MACDLHTHSTASDGTDPPAALARKAADIGLTALALTDHDTTAGLTDCEAACLDAGVRFVPGIELSADPGSLRANAKDGRVGTLHILGLAIDPQADHLGRIQARLRQARAERNPELVANLQELGFDITYDQVLEIAGGDDQSTIVGRPHIAQALVNAGVVDSVSEAFDRYIGEGRPAYTRKDRLPPEEAIEAIHAAGGVAILAHPVQLKLSPDDLATAIGTLIDAGLDGLEVHHSDHGDQDVTQLRALADRHGLLTSGGSDYHGDRKSIELGQPSVPAAWCDRLLEAAGATL